MLEKVGHLFTKERLQDVLEGLGKKVSAKVDSIRVDQFNASTGEELLEHLLPNLLLLPITLHEGQIEMEQFEAMVDITGDPARDTRGGQITKIMGIRIDISIPFSGGCGLWELAPDQCSWAFPLGYIESSSLGLSGILHIIKEQPNDVSMEQLKPEVEKELKLIRMCLSCQRTQIENFNVEFAKHLKVQIQNRRTRLELHKTVPNILRIPLKRKVGAPNFEPIEIRRKLQRPLPEIPVADFPPEPGILETTYQHILSVIRHAGKTFETTPKTFAIHDEEELRNIILAHLNGHYEGAATGETFRKKGKTDIRIEDRSRDAFIGECKVWRGSKELGEAIDQMLGYATWRDCKAALVVFNKDYAKFSELLAKIPDVLKGHLKFKHELALAGLGEWKVQFHTSEDDDHLVTVTVFVFNLFQPRVD